MERLGGKERLYGEGGYGDIGIRVPAMNGRCIPLIDSVEISSKLRSNTYTASFFFSLLLKGFQGMVFEDSGNCN